MPISSNTADYIPTLPSTHLFWNPQNMIPTLRAPRRRIAIGVKAEVLDAPLVSSQQGKRGEPSSQVCQAQELP